MHRDAISSVPDSTAACRVIHVEPGRNTHIELGRCYAQLVVAGYSREAYDFAVKHQVGLNGRKAIEWRQPAGARNYYAQRVQA